MPFTVFVAICEVVVCPCDNKVGPFTISGLIMSCEGFKISCFVLAQGSRKPSWWCSDVGFSMKTIAAIALFCSFAGMVFAESLECSPTPGAGDLLAVMRFSNPIRRSFPQLPLRSASTRKTVGVLEPDREHGVACERQPVAAGRKADHAVSGSVATGARETTTPDTTSYFSSNGRSWLWYSLKNRLAAERSASGNPGCMETREKSGAARNLTSSAATWTRRSLR